MDNLKNNSDKRPTNCESIFLYINDLKERYKIGNDAVYSLVRKPSFPATKIGNRFCVRFDHLLKYEEECFKKRTAIV
jgi:hypothetical protein